MPANYESWREGHAKGVKIFQPSEIIDLPHAALDGVRQEMLLGLLTKHWPTKPVLCNLTHR